MKIIWHSNASWVPSGYGQQTALFTPRLRDLGHDVAVSCYYGLSGSGLVWNGIKHYPGDGSWNGKLKEYTLDHADGEDCLAVTLMDVWVLDPEKLPDRVASWVPVDHQPCPPSVSEFFRKTGATPIAMSRFGQAELEKAGLEPLYVPHGFDPAVFYPRDRAECREKHGIPADAFVVGMVAANKGIRKGFGQAFQAFARFREKRPDAFLYVHTDWTDVNGAALPELAAACGLGRDAMRVTDPIVMSLGEDANTVAEIHSAFDVLLNPAFGEGFGVPIIEAQACGTPVVVTDWSAMPELCGAGWLVDGDRWWDTRQCAWFMCPSVGDIVACLEEAYSEAEGLREQAVGFAAPYAADRVTEDYWRPAVEALGAEARELVAA